MDEARPRGVHFHESVRGDSVSLEYIYIYMCVCVCVCVYIYSTLYNLIL